MRREGSGGLGGESSKPVSKSRFYIYILFIPSENKQKTVTYTAL
jgi:hypothetical protein